MVLLVVALRLSSERQFLRAFEEAVRRTTRVERSDA